MTKTRKARVSFSPEQKLDYAKSTTTRRAGGMMKAPKGGY